MNKTFFQKLLLSIPLRPNIAILFAIILGALGLFLPWVYLFITAPDARGTITSIVLPQIEITGVFDLGYCEAFGAKTLVKLPTWLNHNSWNGFLRAAPLIIGIYYYFKHKSTKSRKTFGLISLCILVLFIAYAILFTPDRIICNFETQLTIHNYSISWFSISVPIIAFLLGIFADYKRDLLMKFKLH